SWNSQKLLSLMPQKLRERVDPYFEALGLLAEIRDPKVLASLGPPGVRGLLLKRGKQGVPTLMPSGHDAHFDWSYPADHADMRDLYQRAKQGQWDSDTTLPWHISVDPENPEVPLLPRGYFALDVLSESGIRLSPKEEQRLLYSMLAWMLSQFL